MQDDRDEPDAFEPAARVCPSPVEDVLRLAYFRCIARRTRRLEARRIATRTPPSARSEAATRQLRGRTK
jgi:hypothetical protein